ncbi:hypothetical protein HF1_06140 [Mycoplasma haemofelis str. Langford 1]|uniref:Uncharacterized protein n=1 Tax=Mycoplasma haemofelis (strain Langford 1) TaxID=941640 RepID=E8ZHK1_MYCHL|nr:hypothetical protein [Mycoplasma haemofelis]CBY92622.1 hypothetical protein HF1_06140 [Mycoplasma haemofelis str. Langford 1]
MSSSIAKSVTTSATVAVISGVGFKTAETLFQYPTNKAHLESQHYKSLFEVRKNQFTRWRERFLHHREELIRLIPEINSHSSRNEGAYFLKKWCYQNLYERYSVEKIEIFNQLKLFCTIDIKSFLLEEEDSQTIDDMKETELHKEEIFRQHKESAIKEGILKERDDFNVLLSWCKSTLRERYKPENIKTIRNAREFCLAPDSNIFP